jgi:drug/metabolite transporter (DMT)-like permease
MWRARGPEGATAGLAAVILGAVAWGCTGIFVKEIRLAALPLTFCRLWLGVVLLAALLVVRRRSLSLAVLSRCVLPGLFLAADMALFFSALKLTTVAVATVIGALQPALVLLVAGRLFGERVGWRVVIWTVVSIVGISAVALGPGVPHGQHLTGDALAVGSLIAFTGYWLVSKRVIGVSVDSERYTFGVMLVAAVAMTPIALLSGQRLVPVHHADWFWLALLALVPGGGHLLFNFAHRFVDVSVSSVVSAGNPIVASVLALLVLREPLDAVQVAGGIVAVLAIAAVAHSAGDPARAGSVAVEKGLDLGASELSAIAGVDDQAGDCDVPGRLEGDEPAVGLPLAVDVGGTSLGVDTRAEPDRLGRAAGDHGPHHLLQPGVGRGRKRRRGDQRAARRQVRLPEPPAGDGGSNRCHGQR